MNTTTVTVPVRYHSQAEVFFCLSLSLCFLPRNSSSFEEEDVFTQSGRSIARLTREGKALVVEVRVAVTGHKEENSYGTYLLFVRECAEKEHPHPYKTRLCELRKMNWFQRVIQRARTVFDSMMNTDILYWYTGTLVPGTPGTWYELWW